MLLYLGSSENNSILESLNERKIIVKKLLGEVNFRKFVIHDMKNLDHYSYVVVDLEALNDSDEEIIEAIVAFKMLYNPRLIILSKEITNQFLYRIVNEANLYDVIVAKEEEEIGIAFKLCLDQEEKFRTQLRTYVKKLNLKYSFPHENIKILVGGIGSIFNTTKTAINLATSLSEIGAKVAYTETFTTEGYLKKIANHYKFKDSNYMDISFYFNGDIPFEYNFNVVDVGVLNERSLKIFNSRDFGEVKVICSSVKQHELEDLIKVLEANNQVDVILTYSSDKEKNYARKLFKNKGNIYFTNNSPGLFDTTNSSIFREILSKYIIENN